MALESFNKQSYEQFTVVADFYTVLTEGETLSSTIGDHNVKAWDKNGVDVSSTVLDSGSLAVVSSPTDGTLQAALQILVKAGSQDLSPYKITFYAVTTASPVHKWELDVKMKVKEL